ncbi:hypothetical protein CYMTET_31907 [Cymbomonas tetramitiformis]|uniref:Uncharacterized protein n=1 Tax=Cymbomonas tetramitiformis TaxID=36881 RepID=A0AAE0KSH2_9CHLO|nr:hypothetical protein CYMTET_31907 [Cymbomonas tetramitiformis]
MRSAKNHGGKGKHRCRSNRGGERRVRLPRAPRWGEADSDPGVVARACGRSRDGQGASGTELEMCPSRPHLRGSLRPLHCASQLADSECVSRAGKRTEGKGMGGGANRQRMTYNHSTVAQIKKQRHRQHPRGAYAPPEDLVRLLRQATLDAAIIGGGAVSSALAGPADAPSPPVATELRRSHSMSGAMRSLSWSIRRHFSGSSMSSGEEVAPRVSREDSFSDLAAKSPSCLASIGEELLTKDITPSQAVERVSCRGPGAPVRSMSAAVASVRAAMSMASGFSADTELDTVARHLSVQTVSTLRQAEMEAAPSFSRNPFFSHISGEGASKENGDEGTAHAVSTARDSESNDDPRAEPGRAEEQSSDREPPGDAEAEMCCSELAAVENDTAPNAREELHDGHHADRATVAARREAADRSELAFASLHARHVKSKSPRCKSMSSEEFEKICIESKKMSASILAPDATRAVVHSTSNSKCYQPQRPAHFPSLYRAGSL